MRFITGLLTGALGATTIILGPLQHSVERRGFLYVRRGTCSGTVTTKTRGIESEDWIGGIDMRKFSKLFGPDTGKLFIVENYYSCLGTTWQLAFEIIQREIESGSTIND